MDDKEQSKQGNKIEIQSEQLAVGELAQRAALAPRVETIESPDGVRGQFAVIPTVDANGRASVKLESVARFVDENRARPARRMGTAMFTNLLSLIDHVNRFKNADSVVFADADRKRPSITAVLDYHRAGHGGSPEFGQHRSAYSFPLSTEWVAWGEVNGKELSQAEFAEFIEAHIVDVVEFSDGFNSAAAFADKCGLSFAMPAKILELSRGLAVNVEEKVAQVINLQSGEKQIQFTESHSGQNGAPLKVPGAFLIGIPVFHSGDLYQVCVRLRYRKRGTSLIWIMDLWRHAEVFDAAIVDACEKVKGATELPLLYGCPE